MKRDFIINELYHTYNRGVEKREIFQNEEDYYRAVHDLYEFNNSKAIINLNYRAIKNYGNPISINIDKRPRDLLVNLVCWSLMPNHYHLLSRPKTKDGISKFHQKFGIGYTNYFNLKSNRSGVLFQGKFKAVRVENDAQFSHLVCYIHSNLVDLWKPNWREIGLTTLELQNALKFLEKKKNRWSSYQDYLGIKNFPSLITSDFLFKFFGGPEGYRNFFRNWLKQYDKNINFIQKLTLE